MEGALQSGVRAAKAIVATCAKPAVKAAAPGSVKQKVAVPAEEEVFVTVGAGNGRSEAERSFLHGLLRELGHYPMSDLSPVGLFRAALRNRPLIREAQGLVTVVAIPS